MRIITGSARGAKLKTPKGWDTRPTADRVKESLFNVLGRMVEGRTVLDMDRDEKQGSTANLVLTAAGDEGRILAALRELPVVRKAEGHGGSDGTEVRLQVIRQDENGRAEDQIFRVMARLNAPIRQLREEQDTLEEVFLKVCQ